MAAVVEQRHHFRIGKHLSRLKSAARNPPSVCVYVCVRESQKLVSHLHLHDLLLLLRGYNIGVRLIEDFLSRSSIGRCQDFRETADVIAKVRWRPPPPLLRWEEFRGEVHDGRRGSSYYIIVGTRSPHVSTLIILSWTSLLPPLRLKLKDLGSIQSLEIFKTESLCL